MKLSLRLLRGTFRSMTSILTLFDLDPALRRNSPRELSASDGRPRCGGHEVWRLRAVGERTPLNSLGWNAGCESGQPGGLAGSRRDRGQREAVLQALADRGFPARERSLEGPPHAMGSADSGGLSWWRQWRQLMVALVLLLLSVLGHLSEAGHLALPVIGSLPFHATLATVALIGPGRPILVGGFKAARIGAPSMDTLVGLGVGSAYLASLVALVWPAVGWPCFFNEPVMLLGFVLLGRFLEERARFRTGQALQQLAQLQPDVARLLLADGEIREVRVGALRPGERVQLLAGDRVPVDGVVTEGCSAVDVSSLTGEPLPLNAGRHRAGLGKSQSGIHLGDGGHQGGL